MEVVLTTGAISHHQQTNTQFFTGRMPFLSPNQRCQSTEGTVLHILHRINKILSTSDFFQWALAQVPEDIPLNYTRTAVLYVSDPHFSVSVLLMYGIVYQQALILAHLEVLATQLNSRIYLYF